jgi:DNA repair photolyase
MDDFMECARRGFFRVVNPFNRRESIVEFSPDRVHTVVFWSKNYGKFIAGKYAGTLQKMGYNLFFNFTVNSDDSLLEPGLPPVDRRLEQMRTLCGYAGPKAVFWRFDPVCYYRTADGEIRHNRRDFSKIADAASESGVRVCITSFLDLYAKVKKRAATVPGFSFVDLPPEEKTKILMEMERELEKRDMRLYACCEKSLLETLPPGSAIEPSSCVPNRLLSGLYGPDLSLRKDTGQRVVHGCGCGVSVDIGTYHLQPCYHNCLFCYANPASDKNFERKDEYSR